MARVNEIMEIRDAVSAAITPGEDGTSKILEKEYQWAVNFGLEHGRAALASFIEGRQPITAGIRRLLACAAEFKAAKEKPAAIDDVQRQINAQLGLSDETFLKYNPRS